MSPFRRLEDMSDILHRVQTDLSKLQKTIEKEGEVLLDKIKTAANKAASNKNVVEKRKEIGLLVEAQYKKFEPTLDRIYKDLKGTAEKYGVDVEKIENGVKATTERAAHHLGLGKYSPTKAPKKAAEKAAEHLGSTGEKKKPGRKKGAKKA